MIETKDVKCVNVMLGLINYIGEITWIGALVNVVYQPGESPGIKSLNHRVPAKIFHYTLNAIL